MTSRRAGLLPFFIELTVCFEVNLIFSFAYLIELFNLAN